MSNARAALDRVQITTGLIGHADARKRRQAIIDELKIIK
jgi:hypothetical protein